MTDPEGVDDVIDELKHDHENISALFTQLVDIPPGDTDRKQLLDELTVELIRHLIVEENYLYPAVRKCLTDGDRIADDALATHAGVEELLKELEDRDASDRDFDQLVTVLRNEMTAHIGDEGHIVFAQLRRDCPEDERKELGERVRKARPSAGPASASDVGPGAGLVDRIRAAHGDRS